ncbi:vicilin-like seed storage protein At2g28490 [Setaria italica]|uniref:Cupin type-1 domain-containing protein n=2 Tax=Setaria italica TaxID=4555 RepID=K4A8E5_SETIT|nr:vicilin-like seed storage protein At2g28490 [Setaria italica]
MGRVAVMAPLLFSLLLLASRCAAAAAPRHDREWGWEEGEGEWRPEKEKEQEEGEGKGKGRGLFVLDRLEKVVESEGGQVRVVRGQPWPPASFACREGLMHLGFITMEPRTLFVPQYLGSNVILFVRRGEVKVGYIYKDELVERKLKMGDVLHIDAGSTFYMVNTGKGQRLQIICSIDASDSLGFGPPYLSFFLGGAGHQASVLAGFEPKTLAMAFNATYDELARVILAQTRGPIVYYTAEEPESGGKEERVQGNGLDKGSRRREAGAWRPGGRGEEDDEAGEDALPTWSWRKLVNRFIGGAGGVTAEANKKDKKKGSAPKPYNLYDSEPGFRNTYGWTIAVDKHDYEPLKHSDIGVYLVNLTAGSMLAPHVNPRATEYGVVLGGEGKIQVVFPNGSLAMSAVVRAGDVFWIPRFFAFCQVAARGGPFEFFGFTTSARRNRPQFLVGATSVLRAMLGPEVAAGFGAREKEFRELVLAQEEALILPSFPDTGKREKEKHGRKGKEEEEHGKGKGRREAPLVIEQVAKE